MECGTRLTSIKYDMHTKCVKCKGQDCNKDLTCDKCINWEAKSEFLASHIKKLEIVRKAAVRAKSLDTLKSKELVSSPTPSTSHSLLLMYLLLLS